MGDRKRAEKTLRVVQGILGMVPDLAAGPIDDAVLAALKALVSIVREWVAAGRDVEELRRVLQLYTSTPLEGLDREARLAKVLEELGLPAPTEDAGE